MLQSSKWLEQLCVHIFSVYLLFTLSLLKCIPLWLLTHVSFYSEAIFLLLKPRLWRRSEKPGGHKTPQVPLCSLFLWSKGRIPSDPQEQSLGVPWHSRAPRHTPIVRLSFLTAVSYNDNRISQKWLNKIIWLEIGQRNDWLDFLFVLPRVDT